MINFKFSMPRYLTNKHVTPQFCRIYQSWASIEAMLVRFTTLARDVDSGHTSGILVAAHTLRDDGDISVEEHAELRQVLAWFTEHLPVPKVLADIEHRRAISWFKPAASQAIRKMWELKLVLEAHGSHVNVLQTREPGVVVYEDKWQVVAKPPKGVSF
jgi:uncharacterized protein YfcZ (UPF0381/DUF406 family)